MVAELVIPTRLAFFAYLNRLMDQYCLRYIEIGFLAFTIRWFTNLLVIKILIFD